MRVVKTFLLGFFLLSFRGNCVSLYRVENVVSFYETIKAILNAQNADSSSFGGVCYDLILSPGMYKIPEEESLWTRWEQSPKNYRILRSNHSRLRIIVDYHDPHDDEVLFDGSFARVMRKMEAQFRKGLKLSRTMIFTVNSLSEFYLRLRQTERNRQDTIIRLPKCISIPCIRNPKWLRRFKKLTMARPDGMRLRIQSRYVSKDMDKFEFFLAGLEPFLAPASAN